MAGMAIGMTLSGMKPVLIFERHDFMLLASDQIINHLGKINTLSHGQFNPKVIIRAIVGYNKPFDPGIQHKGNFTNLFKQYCFFPVYDCTDEITLAKAYGETALSQSSIMIVEHRGLYQ
jgi:pyruvate/2-oxoglutarate/acetoin dehydrogenase E1 component